MEKDIKKKVWGGRTVAEKKRDADQHKSTFLSVSSIDAIPDSAHEKNWQSDTENPWANKSNKYMFKSNMLDHKNDDMPPHYWHIRDGPCSVKPKYYITMHKLKSELHLWENQAKGAISTIANNLFGREEYGEWKRYEIDEPTT